MPQEGSSITTRDRAWLLARPGRHDSNSSVAGTMSPSSPIRTRSTGPRSPRAQTPRPARCARTSSNDEQTALNQLYSTEDPSRGRQTPRQNMLANAQLTKPLLNPAGALFAPITAGVGNALSGFLNPTAYINPGAASAGGAATPSGIKLRRSGGWLCAIQLPQSLSSARSSRLACGATKAWRRRRASKRLTTLTTTPTTSGSLFSSAPTRPAGGGRSRAPEGRRGARRHARQSLAGSASRDAMRRTSAPHVALWRVARRRGDARPGGERAPVGESGSKPWEPDREDQPSDGAGARAIDALATANSYGGSFGGLATTTPIAFAQGGNDINLRTPSVRATSRPLASSKPCNRFTTPSAPAPKPRRPSARRREASRARSLRLAAREQSLISKALQQVSWMPAET